MSPVEWYYAHGDKQQGPVSPAEIKALADSGKLQPEDLVWREGMDEWIAARKVKGLFGAGEPAVAKPPQAAPPGPAAPPAPPLTPVAPAFEKSPTAFQRAREGPARHLFDFVLEFARSQFTGQFVESTSKIFTAVGHYGLYAAMLVLFSFTLLLSIKADRLTPILLGLGGVVVLYVLQYTASRFCTALVRLNQGSPGQITSTAFLDCWALVHLALGVALLIGLAVSAIQTEIYGLILIGLMGFILCEYAGFVSLNPESMKIAVSSEVRAGEEAIGIFTFLLKLGLMVAPVAFGAGVACGTIDLLYCCYLVFQAEKASLEMAPSVVTMPALIAAGWTIFFAAVPLLVYVKFLLHYLAVDLIRALLSLPGKLDKLAAGPEESKEEE